jgi:riboflavin biosynthesis pyrimidine reductase
MADPTAPRMVALEPGDPLELPDDLETRYLIDADRHLRADFVTSLDGAVELDGRSAGLSGPGDRVAFMAMRAVTDVILVGAGTVRAEGYGPPKLDQAVRSRRSARGQQNLPALAIVSNSGKLDPTAKVFSGDEQPLLLTSAAAVASHQELEAVADVVVCGDQYVDLPVAIDQLGRRGLGRVLCEGGPTLFRSLLDADLVDELCLSIAPVLAGWGHHTLLGEQPLDQQRGLLLASVVESDGTLFARYQRHPR